MSDFFNATVEYSKSGGDKHKMPLPEGTAITLFRVVVPAWLGEDFGAYPVCYYTHSVSPSHSGATKVNFDSRIVCLGSPEKPDSMGGWPLTEEGVLRCQSFKLPSGIALHETSEVDQRFRVLVYQYNKGESAVRALKFWDHRVGSKSRGMFGRLMSAIQEQVSVGYKPEDILLSLKDVSTDKFTNYEVSAVIPAPNSETAQKYALTDAILEQIKTEAAEVLIEFLHRPDEEEISRMLGMEAPNIEPATPAFNSGLGGPGI